MEHLQSVSDVGEFLTGLAITTVLAALILWIRDGLVFACRRIWEHIRYG